MIYLQCRTLCKGIFFVLRSCWFWQTNDKCSAALDANSDTKYFNISEVEQI